MLLDKFSLKFKNRKMESKYNERNWNMPYFILKLFYMLAGCSAVYEFIYLAVNEFESNTIFLISDISRTTLYIILSFIIKKVKWVKDRSATFCSCIFYGFMIEVYLGNSTPEALILRQNKYPDLIIVQLVIGFAVIKHSLSLDM